MDTGLSLKLILEKGPRWGETIECRPGRSVRIGRVLRGNTFTIKDRSISQKHVTIEFTNAGRGRGSWTLTDHNTSNGTFLNTTELKPDIPALLKHGDVIKIGADTSISVQIMDPKVEEEKPEEAPTAIVTTGRPKRAAAMRKVRGEASRLAAEAEEWMGKDSEASRAVKMTCRSRRNAAVADSTTQLPSCPEDGPVEAEQHKEDPSAPEPEDQKAKDSLAGRDIKRTGRSRRNAVVANSTTQLPKDFTSPEDVPVETEQCKDDTSTPEPEKKPAQPPGRAGRRRGTKKATVEEVINIHPEAQDKDVIVLDMPDRHEVTDKPDVRKHLQQPYSGLPDKPDNYPVYDGVVAPASVATTTVVADSAELGDTSDNDVDMDNMTLGQWFDRLEKVLPLMLQDVCDEVISEIKEKTQRYHLFVLESANDGR